MRLTLLKYFGLLHLRFAELTYETILSLRRRPSRLPLPTATMRGHV